MHILELFVGNTRSFQLKEFISKNLFSPVEEAQFI